MRWPLVLFSLLLLSAVAPGQSVVSVRSGLINYSEGAVFIDNQVITPKPGKYPTLHEGSDLLTHDGRAEIQLTPEAYLRVGVNSGVRMVSSSFADTRIQVLSGSVILDSGNARSDTAVTLVACGASVKVEKPARIRVDTDAAELRVEKGQAEVEREGHVTKVAADQMLGLTGTPVVRRMADTGDDALELWSQQRNRLIYLSLANDRNVLDPGTTDPAASNVDLSAWLGYLPSAGIAPMAGTYNSIILPGYGYYSPFNTLAFYGPLYGGYQMGYAGIGYGLSRAGAIGGAIGSPVGFGFHPTPIYRTSPIYTHTPIGLGAPSAGTLGTFAPRPVGGIRIGVPSPGVVMPGMSAPGRSAAPRPAVPHVPVHR